MSSPEHLVEKYLKLISKDKKQILKYTLVDTGAPSPSMLTVQKLSNHIFFYVRVAFWQLGLAIKS